MRKILALIMSAAMTISLFTGVVSAQDITSSVAYFVDGASSDSIASGEVSVLVNHTALSTDTTVTGVIYENGRLFSVKTAQAEQTSTLLTYGSLVIDPDKTYTFKPIYLSDDSALGLVPEYEGRVYTASAFLVVSDSIDSFSVTNPKLSFYESESSNKEVEYTFGAMYDELYGDAVIDAKLYINGVEDEGFPTDPANRLNKYILNNPSTTVTLFDDGFDGTIDVIKVDYYVDAVVSSVAAVSNTEYRIYFNDYGADIKRGNIIVNTSEGVSAKFILDGEEIEYTDLSEGDVLSIAYDLTDGFENSSFYDVLVSRDVINVGLVTGSTTDNNGRTLYQIEGNDYALTSHGSCLTPVAGEKYTFYLNAFGEISSVEQYIDLTEYAIFDSAEFTENGGLNITLIDMDGTVNTYSVKNSLISSVQAEISVFYTTLLTGVANPYSDENRVALGNRIVRVFKNSGVITSVQLVTSKSFITGGDGLKYKEAFSKIGAYAIDEKTAIIDISANGDVTGNGAITSVSLKSLSDLEDGAYYNGYVALKSDTTAVYNILIITDSYVIEPTPTPSPDGVDAENTGISVYQSHDTMFDENYGGNVMYIEAYKNGAYADEEAEKGDILKTLFTKAELEAFGLVPGSVFVYTQDSDGYVDSIVKVYNGPETEYVDFIKGVSSLTTTTSYGKTVWSNTYLPTEWAQTYDTTRTGNVEILFGAISAVNRNNISVAQVEDCTLADGTTVKGYDVELAEDFTIAGDANIYTYDYSYTKSADRLYIGGQVIKTPQGYSTAGEGSDTKNIVPLCYEDGECQTINFIFAKLVDDVITECVVILGK